VRLDFGDAGRYGWQKSQIFGELLFLKKIIQFKISTHSNELPNDLIKINDDRLTKDNHQVKWNNITQLKLIFFYHSFMPEIEVSHSFFKSDGNRNYMEGIICGGPGNEFGCS
jgi:hypothetical protein